MKWSGGAGIEPRGGDRYTGLVDKLLACAAYILTIFWAAGSPAPDPGAYEEFLGQEHWAGFFVDEDGRLTQAEGADAPTLTHETEYHDFVGDVNTAGRKETREPHQHGTPYLADIIQSSDSTMFSELIAQGRTRVEAHGQKLPDEIARGIDPHLFVAVYLDGLVIEFVVDGTLGDGDMITDLATEYADEFGKLPRLIRTGLKTAVIVNNSRNYYAHTESGTVVMGDGHTRRLRQGGWWGEVLFHECAHVSLDDQWGDHPEWRRAQAEDGGFISKYAEDNPEMEDLAETSSLWYGLRYRPERMSAELRKTVEETIPARLRFLDSLAFEH